MDEQSNEDGRLRFEWDPKKAAENFRKHGVRFGEAETAFADDRSIDVYDPDHSDREDQFVKIGRSTMNRIIVLVYTERQKTIRIISARRANRRERQHYESQP
jgi:uncharacterized DUF497 family protein